MAKITALVNLVNAGVAGMYFGFITSTTGPEGYLAAMESAQWQTIGDSSSSNRPFDDQSMVSAIHVFFPGEFQAVAELIAHLFFGQTIS